MQISRLLQRMYNEPMEDAPVVDLSPGDKHSEEASATGDDEVPRQPMTHESNTSDDVAIPVRFHSKSAGRCVHGDRAKRVASDPFTHKMMAVAMKTAKKTSASATVVVQKTAVCEEVANNIEDRRTSG